MEYEHIPEQPPTKHTPVDNKRYFKGGHTSMQRLLDREKRTKQTC